MPAIEPARLEQTAYPIQRTLTVRVCDLDGYGHLNAIRIGHYYEDARASFYGDAFAGSMPVRLLVAEIRLRYLREGFWPGSLTVGTGIAHIGNRSTVMAQGLFNDAGICIGLCDTVLVNTGASGTEALPVAVRTDLARFLIAGAASPERE